MEHDRRAAQALPDRRDRHPVGRRRTRGSLTRSAMARGPALDVPVRFAAWQREPGSSSRWRRPCRSRRGARSLSMRRGCATATCTSWTGRRAWSLGSRPSRSATTNRRHGGRPRNRIRAASRKATESSSMRAGGADVAGIASRAPRIAARTWSGLVTAVVSAATGGLAGSTCGFVVYLVQLAISTPLAVAPLADAALTRTTRSGSGRAARADRLRRRHRCRRHRPHGRCSCCGLSAQLASWLWTCATTRCEPR